MLNIIVFPFYLCIDILEVGCLYDFIVQTRILLKRKQALTNDCANTTEVRTMLGKQMHGLHIYKLCKHCCFRVDLPNVFVKCIQGFAIDLLKT